MEENQETKTVDTEELKKETVNTVNQVKDTIKNADIKKDAKEAKNFVSEMVKEPIETIKNIATDSNNKHFKTAIVLSIVWMAIILIKTLINTTWYSKYAFKIILGIVKSVVAPVIGIIVLATIVYLMNRKSKKSLVTNITAITVARIPRIISAIVGLLTIISANASRLTSPFSSLCTVISTVLTYFAIKELYGEEDNSKFLKTFILVEAIYYVCYILIGFLGIYI